MEGVLVFIGFVLAWLAVWAALSVEAHPWLLEGRPRWVVVHRSHTPLRFWSLISVQGLAGLAIIAAGLSS